MDSTMFWKCWSDLDSKTEANCCIKFIISEIRMASPTFTPCSPPPRTPYTAVPGRIVPIPGTDLLLLLPDEEVPVAPAQPRGRPRGRGAGRPPSSNNSVVRKVEVVKADTLSLEDDDDDLTCRICMSSFWYKSQIVEHLSKTHSVKDPEAFIKEKRRRVWLWSRRDAM